MAVALATPMIAETIAIAISAAVMIMNKNSNSNSNRNSDSNAACQTRHHAACFREGDLGDVGDLCVYIDMSMFTNMANVSAIGWIRKPLIFVSCCGVSLRQL